MPTKMSSKFHKRVERAASRILREVVLETYRESTEFQEAVRARLREELRWPCLGKCKICFEAYLIDSNGPDKCRSHTGLMEEIPGALPWDCVNDRSRRAARIIFPECFQWTCCGGDLNSKPCRIGKHESLEYEHLDRSGSIDDSHSAAGAVKEHVGVVSKDFEADLALDSSSSGSRTDDDLREDAIHPRKREFL
ncbi:hypothetical protein HYALB_00005726 [Hymenoscyphus albidus]|uniref:Uncharacterized protein n=1 Tax=Hymenoscyphus albidus TaxID=595503 RepID=A0A9N9Q1P8_9HELO|nr:hypothetical protein HYALB_00005726 [Hymenoscyphus albidus]